jgi:hypothetical protein
VDYQLTIHTPGETAVRHITTDPDSLAQAVHHHARGLIGSTRTDILFHPDVLAGTIASHGTPAGDFTLEAIEQTEDSPNPDGFRHGYTLADVQHLTRLTLRLDRWHTAGDISERYEAVWFAIVEHLLTSNSPPGRSELLRVGTEASDNLVRDNMRTHGKCTRHFGRPMPEFFRYWNPIHTASPEARIIEREALTQIWDLLRPSEQRALTALAATGDYAKAAEAAGVTGGTFTVLISSARRRFLAAWHEGETPSRMWRTDRRVSSRTGRDHLGRQRLTAPQVDAYRERHYAGEKLNALAAECGLTPTGLSRLIKGQTKPAEVAA